MRARRRGPDDAAALARQFAGLLQPLIVLDEGDLQRGLALFPDTDAIGPFDCVLAATAIRRGARAFVSADLDFREIPGLPLLHPADLQRIVESRDRRAPLTGRGLASADRRSRRVAPQEHDVRDALLLQGANRLVHSHVAGAAAFHVDEEHVAAETGLGGA